MNILQGIEAPVTFCVSLNQTALIDPAQDPRPLQYAHPQYSLAALAAQARQGELQGAAHITAAPTGPTAFTRTAWSAHCVAEHFGERCEQQPVQRLDQPPAPDPRPHAFRYRIGMFYLDLDEQPWLLGLSRWLGRSRLAPLCWRETDYLPALTGGGMRWPRPPASWSARPPGRHPRAPCTCSPSRAAGGCRSTR
jgi:hypothetical protein